MTGIKLYYTNTKRILIDYFNDEIIAVYITPKKHIENIHMIEDIWQLVKAEKQKEKPCITQQ